MIATRMAGRNRKGTLLTDQHNGKETALSDGSAEMKREIGRSNNISWVSDS